MRAQAVGRYGERVAATHLEADGMQLLARNWRCPHGEIDIVAVDAGCLVVAEVKTRSSTRCGAPVEAVTPRKLARLRRLTAAWLADQPAGFADIRIDVLDVLCRPRGAATVTHLRGVG
jgi:putative endonuclease